MTKNIALIGNVFLFSFNNNNSLTTKLNRIAIRLFSYSKQ